MAGTSEVIKNVQVIRTGAGLDQTLGVPVSSGVQLEKRTRTVETPKIPSPATNTPPAPRES